MSTTTANPAPDLFEVTVRGLSLREVEAKAVRECCRHFGNEAWQFCECNVKPCVTSLGGRVRLCEGRFVASANRS